jgi:hypothetical protein
MAGEGPGRTPAIHASRRPHHNGVDGGPSPAMTMWQPLTWQPLTWQPLTVW